MTFWHSKRPAGKVAPGPPHGNTGEVDNFVRKCRGSARRRGKAQLTRLFVDADAVAAALILRSASSAWLWKIAYAERFARFSPGVQIVLDVTEQLLRDRTVKRADSCATADHPMIDHPWRERLVIADRLVSVGRGHVRELALVHRAEWLRRALIDCAKAVRDLLPRR